jgi:hypothetical protein
MEGILALLIPVLALSIPIVAIWTKHQQKMAEMGVRPGTAEPVETSAYLAGQVQRLEERVRVLERIVTDGGYDVAAQIEALRDPAKLAPAADSGVPIALAQQERA